MTHAGRCTRLANLDDELLRRALALSHDALQLIGSLLPDDCTFGTMPHASIYRLHVGATANYRGGLTCLRSAETSLAAAPLIRALLEAWAHIDFIGDDTQDGDARCRALMYERGGRQEWSAIAKGPLAHVDLTDWQKHHDEQTRKVEELWKSFGCGKPQARTYKQAQVTLRALSKRHSMPWIMPVWRSTSAHAHAFGSDIAFDNSKQGSSGLVWAAPPVRTFWLQNLVAVYGNLTSAAALSMAPGPEPRSQTDFQQTVHQLTEEVGNLVARQLGF
jgi:hypothetical protein